MLEKTDSHFVISQPTLAPLIAKVRAELDSKQYTLRVDELPDLYATFPTLNSEPDVVEAYPSSGKQYSMDA